MSTLQLDPTATLGPEGRTPAAGAADVLVIVPSRGRPAQAAACVAALRANSVRSDILLAVDEDDPALPAYREIAGAALTVGPREGLVATLNRAARANADRYRYLAFLGDDHRVRTPGWDDLLARAIADEPFGVAYGNDLLQGDWLPTAVLLDAAIVRCLGWMAPPVLRHTHKDNVWKVFGQRLGTLRYHPGVVVEHLHHSAGKSPDDPTYREGSARAEERDGEAWARYAGAALDADLARLRHALGVLPPPPLDDQGLTRTTFAGFRVAVPPGAVGLDGAPVGPGGEARPFVDGPVRLAGPVVGASADGWAGHRLDLTVTAEDWLGSVTLTGRLPWALGPAVRLRARVNGEAHEAVFDAGAPVAWRLPCAAAPGRPAVVSLEPTLLLEVPDGAGGWRRLGFHLTGATFGPERVEASPVLPPAAEDVPPQVVRVPAGAGADAPVISLLCPTRDRPEGVLRMAVSALRTADRPGRLEILFYVDDDDATFPDLADLGPAARVVRGGRIVMSEMWNVLARAAAGDILMLLGDDCEFRTPGWDDAVRAAFAEWPDGIGLVHGDDLSPHKDTLATHPFVTRRWVETLGRLTSPAFSADYADTWMSDIATMVGRRRWLPEVVTEHHHPHFGKAPDDATYREKWDRQQQDDPEGVYQHLAAERHGEAARLAALIGTPWERRSSVDRLLDRVPTGEGAGGRRIPLTWDEFLGAPVFVINLDRRPDKWAGAEAAIRAAGFRDVRRFAAVDGSDPEALRAGWAHFGTPRLNTADGGYIGMPGHQGAVLSHLAIWERVARGEMPYAIVFEDDPVFHSRWGELGPRSYTETPKDFDLILFGTNPHRLEVAPGADGPVRRAAALSSYAYLVTTRGARTFFERRMRWPSGLRCFDVMVMELGREDLHNDAESAFRCYLWDDETEVEREPGARRVRTRGLVRQDRARWGSDIRDTTKRAAAAPRASEAPETPETPETPDLPDDLRDLLGLLRVHRADSPKVRLGGPRDGGYVIPASLLETCTELVTIGVGGDSTFEEDWHERTGKAIALYDGSCDCPWICTRPARADRAPIVFTRKHVGNGVGEIPLREVIAGKRGILLKMDAEGAEYPTLPEVDLSGCHGLILEVHELADEGRRRELAAILRQIERDFVLVHLHGNNGQQAVPLPPRLQGGGDGLPQVLELTFVNRRVHAADLALSDEAFPVAGLDGPNMPPGRDLVLDWVNRPLGIPPAAAEARLSHAATVDAAADADGPGSLLVPAWRSRARRAGSPGLVVPDGLAVVERTKVGRVHGYAHDRYVLGRLRRTGDWEAGEREAAEWILRPGMHVVDAGANIGYLTLCFARMVGPTGRVLAIEADPVTAKVLELNLVEAGATNVEVLNVAVGDRVGTVAIDRRGSLDGNPGDHRVSATITPESTTVPLVPLDDLLDPEVPVHLVKTDVQGMDHRVVAGMARTIARWSPKIICEWHIESIRWFGDDPAAVLRFYLRDGWTVELLDGPVLARPGAREAVVAPGLPLSLADVDDIVGLALRSRFGEQTVLNLLIDPAGGRA